MQQGILTWMIRTGQSTKGILSIFCTERKQQIQHVNDAYKENKSITIETKRVILPYKCRTSTNASLDT